MREDPSSAPPLSEAPALNPSLPADLQAFLSMAVAAVLSLPEPFREPASHVQLRIEDFPSDELLEEMDLHDPYELTGVYEGTPLIEKSIMDQPMGPDAVTLFRRPILEEWIERGNVPLAELVQHVVIHEFAHHFGWSDEDIAKIDKWWE